MSVGAAAAGTPNRVPIVFMGLMGLDSHNREEEQLVRRLVERGHPLLYLPPLGVRDAGWGDLLLGLRRMRRAGRTANVAPGLRVARLLVLPWRGRRPVAWLNQRLVRWRLAQALGTLTVERPVLWLRLPTPELVDQLPQLGARAVVYDCMDDYSAYPHYRAPERRRLQEVEQRLVAQADLVVTLTEAIAGRFPTATDRVRIVPLGVDLERFGHSMGAEPVDLAQLPRPRLGMVGGLDGRIDLDLLYRLATAEPHWSIVLIGPRLGGLNVGPLADLSNVHLLGPRPYENVPEYLAGLDVCLIPYRRGSWADGCFPTKLHEYLAVGRPVVA
ncbi:MAG: glycosyltransferase, partial [Chloroflexota bacterium]|nr:glycosyltransferase [Chloroflexota bacterium]